MGKINWTRVGIFGIVTLLVFLIGASLLGSYGARGSGWGTIGPGMMGGWSFGPYGWIGMLFMWLIPIGLFVLTILGVVWLARAVGGGGNLVAPMRACPSCGRSVQTDWRNCPYCGTGLTQPS